MKSNMLLKPLINIDSLSSISRSFEYPLTSYISYNKAACHDASES